MRCHICDNLMEGREIRLDPSRRGYRYAPCYQCSSEIAELLIPEEEVVAPNPYFPGDEEYEEDETLM